MLKEIPVNQLRKGMFLNKLCGSWLKHPFWKQAFLLEKNADIQSIVNSGIKSVVIDTSKGLDVEAKQEVKQTPKPNENEPVSADSYAAKNEHVCGMEQSQENLRPGKNRCGSNVSRSQNGQRSQARRCKTDC